MRWNLRMTAAERGIWKSTEMRRVLAEAGLEISAGKMSALWTSAPTTVRLDDLEIICAVLDCDQAALLIREPEKAQARRPRQAAAAGEATPPNVVTPPDRGDDNESPDCSAPITELPARPRGRRLGVQRHIVARGTTPESTGTTDPCGSRRPMSGNYPRVRGDDIRSGAGSG